MSSENITAIKKKAERKKLRNLCKITQTYINFSYIYLYVFQYKFVLYTFMHTIHIGFVKSKSKCLSFHDYYNNITTTTTIMMIITMYVCVSKSICMKYHIICCCWRC